MKDNPFDAWFGKSSKRKGGFAWDDTMPVEKGFDGGKSLGDYMKGVPDIGSDFGSYVSKDSIFNMGGKKGTGSEFGLSGNMMNIGGDYMTYVSKAGQIKNDDFMSYLESGSPKAFKTIGKEPKNITKRRFADKDMEVPYAAESIGFATEGLERNIHRSAKSTLKRASQTKREISSGVKNIKSNVKEGRLGFAEDSVGGRLVSKIKEHKGRKEARKEIEDFMNQEDRQVLIQKRNEDGREKLIRYTKSGKLLRKEEIDNE